MVYYRDIDLNNVDECVSTIVFPISRYGKVTCILTFSEPVTMNDAVESVEFYLSEPMTKDYFDCVADDSFGSPIWEQAQKQWPYRYSALSDARFLEDVQLKGTQAYVIVGS